VIVTLLCTAAAVNVMLLPRCYEAASTTFVFICALKYYFLIRRFWTVTNAAHSIATSMQNIGAV
jgi:hypothetical protein